MADSFGLVVALKNFTEICLSGVLHLDVFVIVGILEITPSQVDVGGYGRLIFPSENYPCLGLVHYARHRSVRLTYS